MIIVGELINASRKAVKAAIASQDADVIRTLAKDQGEADSDYIDVNAGVFLKEEVDYLKWIIDQVLDATNLPCCLDSPNPIAVAAAIEYYGQKSDRVPMINSISLEKNRWEVLLPLVAGTDYKIVALCMSDDGMPETADQRLTIAAKLINGLVKNNVKLENIFVDPLVLSLGTNTLYGKEFLTAVERIMTEFPGVHTMCGLSNISYGLPERHFLNQTFMTMAIGKGLDSAIVNPLDRRMMANVKAAEALAGRDDFCTNFLTAYRGGLFNF
jgi:5-methyltetrahydrofolate--homocysteine methyltransferase